MKNIRTEIHITVATYVGDDISDAKPLLSRSPDFTEGCTVTRVSSLGPRIGAHEAAKGHVTALMANAASVLAEKAAYGVRTL